MSFGLRGGSFGGGNLNPFGTGSSGFGQYAIGDTANDEAALDKYEATIEWQQGRRTNDSYLAALERYLGTTEQGSRERITAEDDLLDARYTISRNEVVSKLNNATGTARRISLWQDLIGIDRKRLNTMTAGDNEQRRELLDRIDDQEGNIRKESWSDLVRRYNSQRGVPVETMLRSARRMANRSEGSKDHRDWLDQVDQWTSTRDDETQNELMAAYNDSKHLRGGSALLAFLDQRIASTGAGTSRHASLTRMRSDVTEGIRTAKLADADSRMNEAWENQDVDDEAYLSYWTKRLRDAPSGTEEKRTLKKQVYDLSFKVAHDNATEGYLRTGESKQLLGVLNARLAGLAPNSDGWAAITKEINDLRTGAYGTISLTEPTAGAGGGYVFVGGSPPPTPGTGTNGFASQYDGSDFANQNCGYTAAAMLAWAAGVKGLSGGDMRWYAGDPSGASYLSGMATAMERVGLGLEINQGLDMGAFRRRVANGEAAIVNGLYGNLTGQFRLSSFAGAHSVTVTQAKKSDGQWWYFVMDPIGRGAKQGAQWWPESAMQAFAWSGATNPISGNRLSGTVAFARKNGKSVRRTSGGGEIPFQAFDTDAYGNDTRGKGGGNSRKEAGYMPPGFAAKARGKDKASGTDAISVEAFLGAVMGIDPSQLSDDPDVEAKQRKRAGRLLDRYDGDVRMAGAQWFNETGTSTDTKSWTANQLWAANAVASAYGLAPVERNEPLVPQAPERAAVVALTPEERASDPGAAPGTTVTPKVVPDSLAGYSQGAIDIATKTLKEAGAQATPEAIRAVVSTLVTLWGGSEIDEMNPWRLRTDRTDAFPGQTGIDPKTGMPTFDDAADLQAAYIGAFVATAPQPFIGALVRGRAEDILDSSDLISPVLEGQAAFHTWNQQPGNRFITGTSTGFTGGATVAAATKVVPELATTMNIDPTDPIQFAHWERNADSLQAAVKAGNAKWSYFPPGGGPPIQVDASPEMLMEFVKVGAQHARQVAGANNAALDADGGTAKLLAAYGKFDLSQMTFDSVRAMKDDLDAQARRVMLDPGGAAKATGIKQAEYAIIAGVLGSVQGTTGISQLGVPGVNYTPVVDFNLRTNPWIDPEETGLWTGLIEEMQNDPLLLLNMPGKDGRRGIDPVTGDPLPDRGFIEIVEDPKLGAVAVMHLPDNSNPEFILSDVTGPDGVVTGQAPEYTHDPNRVRITTSSGGTAWQTLHTAPAGAGTTIFTNVSISTARKASNDAQPGQQNLGPQEMMPQVLSTAGPQGAVKYAVIPDLADETGKRVLWAWTMDGSSYVLTPEGESIQFIYTGKGDVTRGDDGAFLVDGKEADKTFWKDVVPYGTGGAIVKGFEGGGAIGKRYAWRDTTGGSLDAGLSDSERWYLGGSYSAGMRQPPIVAGKMLDRTFADPYGGLRVPVGSAPIGMESGRELAIRLLEGEAARNRSAGQEDRRDLHDSLMAGIEADVAARENGQPYAPVGSSASDSIWARVGGVAPSYSQQTVAIAAQQANERRLASSLSARNQALQAEAVAEARRRVNRQPVPVRPVVNAGRRSGGSWAQPTRPTPRPTPPPVGRIAPTPPPVMPQTQQEINRRAGGGARGGF